MYPLGLPGEYVLNWMNSSLGISTVIPMLLAVTVIDSGAYAFFFFVLMIHSLGMILSWYPDLLFASGRTQT